MVKTWIIRFVVLFIVLFVTVLVVDAITGPAEPDYCALCYSTPLHAPCLLNIETGDLTELRVYEPHPVKAGELAEEQQGGYFSLSMSGGVFVTSDPDAQTARIIIPIEKARLNKSEFCMECRRLLWATEQNYVLVDVYDQENITKYDIVEGICGDMRCYTVSAAPSKDNAEVTITVNGYLHNGYMHND